MVKLPKHSHSRQVTIETEVVGCHSAAIVVAWCIVGRKEALTSAQPSGPLSRAVADHPDHRQSLFEFPDGLCSTALLLRASTCSALFYRGSLEERVD